MGKGRTTTGMIVACLVRDVVHGQVRNRSLILLYHFTFIARIKIRRHYFEALIEIIVYFLFLNDLLSKPNRSSI